MNTNIPITPLMHEGWICPMCGNSNAPWVASCPCGGQRAYIPSVTTDSGTDYKQESMWNKVNKSMKIGSNNQPEAQLL